MLFKSTLLGQTSGSLDATVFSHNRGGRYTRVRATPVNPNTPQQQLVRSLVAQLTGLWSNTLSQAQRDAWDLYALNVELPNRLGELRNVGGIAMYVRSNVPRLQASLARVDDAPIIFDLGGFEPHLITIAAVGTQVFTIDYSFGPALPEPWVSEDGAAILLYTSRPQNPSINFFKGPYRFAAVGLGDSGVPLVFPFSRPVAFAFALGQRIFVRANVTRADGRLGTAEFMTVISTP